MRFILALFLVFLLQPPALAAETQLPGDVAAVSVDAATIKMTIITTGGFVSFRVDKNWRIIGMQSLPPITHTAFQIENSADQETGDSTNLIISLIQPDSDQAAHAMSKIGKKFGAQDVNVTLHASWKVYRQDAKQNKTLYTIIDAQQKVADQVVWVRLAWPHLEKNIVDYDASMEKLFYALVDSVQGKTGPYTPLPGEAFRRPQ